MLDLNAYYEDLLKRSKAPNHKKYASIMLRKINGEDIDIDGYEFRYIPRYFCEKNNKLYASKLELSADLGVTLYSVEQALKSTQKNELGIQYVES